MRRRALSFALVVSLVAPVAAVLGMAVRAPVALADPSATPDRTWVTNGRVSSIVHRNGKIYLGGYFTQVGPNTGQGVVVDAGTAVWNQSFPYINGWVYAAVPDGSGGWYVAGSFDRVGTAFRKNAARITATGAVATWNPAVVGTVYSLALSPAQNRVFLGGDVTMVGTTARTGLASVTADTGALDNSWAPTANGTVRALAVGGGRLYAGGTFTSVSGAARNRLAAVDATTGGVVSGFAPSADAAVNTLALAPGGATLYVGGEFVTLAGAARSRLGALNATTGALTTWSPGADGPVGALTVAAAGSPIYAGGSFTTAGGAARAAVAAIDAATGAATSWDPGATGCTMTAPSDPLCVAAVNALGLSADGSTAYLGGLFNAIGGSSRTNLAAVSTATGAVTAWDPAANGAVRAVAPGSGTVFAGGDLTSVNAVTRNRVAALDTVTGALVPSFTADADDWVEAIALSDDGTRLFLGGGFNKVNGVLRSNLAAVDATSGALDTAWNPSAKGGVVQAMAAGGGRLYVAGRFTTISGLAIGRLGSISQATGAVNPAWNPAPDDWVAAVALSPDGTALYAGGMFTALGGQTRRKLAALSTATGAVTPWAPTVTYPVLTVLPSPDGTLVYAGGAGGRTNGNRASAYSTGAATAPVWETFGGDGNVQALGLSPDGRTLYIGGHFATLNGTTRQHFAAVETTSGGLLAYAPAINSPLGVWTIAMNGGTLYAGGDFTRAATTVQQGFARFPGVGPAVTVTSGPPDGSVTATTRPGYGGTATAASGTVARVEAAVDAAAFSTSGVVCTGCGTASATWTYAPTGALADGLHTITFRALDASGDSASASRTVRVDTTPPVVAVTSGPADGSTAGTSTPTYGGSATDGAVVARVEVATDGGAFSTGGVTCGTCGSAPAPPWSYTPPVPLADGPHTLAFRAVDSVGFASSPVTRSVTVQTSGPSFDSVGAVSGPGAAVAVFSEPLKCSTVSRVDFTAAVNGASRTVNTSTCSGTSDATVDLAVSGSIAGGDVVAVTLAGTVKNMLNLAAPFPSTRSITIADTAAPTLSITSGPADGSVVTTGQPTFGGSAGDDSAVARVEVALDGGSFATTGVACTACGSGSATWTWTPATALADGSHTAAFRAVDAVGNASAPATRTITVDTAPPSFVSVVAVSGPGAAVAVFSKPLKCTSVSRTDFTATVNGSARTVNTSTCSGTSDGTIDLALAGALTGGDVVAVTLAGTVKDMLNLAAPFPTTRSVTVANTPPALTVTSGPADGATTAANRPTWGGTAGDTDGVVTGVEARIDGGAFSTSGVACTGCGTNSVTWTWTPPSALADGTHSVGFRSVDNAAATSAVATRAVTVDTAPPAITVDSGPAHEAFVATDTPAYGGSATDATGIVTGVEVSVDAAAFSSAGVACTGCGTGMATWTWSPAAPLGNGPHTMVFVASDGTGARSATATRTVVVDTAAPVLASLLATGFNPVVTAVFNEPVSCPSVAPDDFTVTVEGGPVVVTGATCNGGSASPVDLTLVAAPASGATVVVTVTGSVFDLAGNSASGASASTVAANPPPTVTVTSGLAEGSTTAATTPAYGGDAGDEGAVTSVEARLDGGAFSTTGVTCTGCGTGSASWAWTPAAALSDGSHTVEFRALDDGGASSPAVTRHLTVDSTAPALSVTSGPTDGSTVSTTQPAYGGSATDARSVDVVVVAVDGGGFAATGVTCTACGTTSATWSWTPPAALTDGAHTVAFQSVDGAGNVSAATVRTVVVDTTAPAFEAVTAVSGTGAAVAIFSEPMKCTSVARADFSATVNGAARTVNTAVCSGTSDGTVDLTLAGTLGGGDAVAVTLVGTTKDMVNLTAPFPTTRTVSASNTAPVLTVSSGPADGTTTNQTTPTWAGGAADGDGTISAVQAGVDGAAPTTAGVACTGCGTSSATWTWTPSTPLADGTHTVSFHAVDNVTGTSPAVTRTVIVDATAPVLVSVGASPGSGPVVVSFSEPLDCSTVAADDFTVTQDAVAATVTTTTCSGPSDATVDLTLAAPVLGGQSVTVALTAAVADSAGNTVAAGNASVTTTNDPPTLTVDNGPPDGTLLAGANPVYTGTANDPDGTITAIEADLDGTGYTTTGVTCTNCATSTASWSWTPSSPLPDGTHTITFRAVDGAAHLSEPTTRTVTVDTTAPALTIESGPDDGAIILTGTPEYGGTAADAVTVVNAVEVDVDGSGYTTTDVTCTNCGTPSATWTWIPASPLPAGNHTITFRILDAAGNFSPPAGRTLTVLP